MSTTDSERSIQENCKLVSRNKSAGITRQRPVSFRAGEHLRVNEHSFITGLPEELKETKGEMEKEGEREREGGRIEARENKLALIAAGSKRRRSKTIS